MLSCISCKSNFAKSCTVSGPSIIQNLDSIFSISIIGGLQHQILASFQEKAKKKQKGRKKATQNSKFYSVPHNGIESARPCTVTD
jgi:hypothetical protein